MNKWMNKWEIKWIESQMNGRLNKWVLNGWSMVEWMHDD